MTASSSRHRQLTAKYKTLRLKPSALYESRIFQTLPNKFIKQGKKSLSRGHFTRARQQIRLRYSGPRIQELLVRALRNVRTQFLLVNVRNGNTREQVPVPVRRNKRDVCSLQSVARAVRGRAERTLAERIQLEFVAIYYIKSTASTLKKRNAYFFKIYEERVLRDKR